MSRVELDIKERQDIVAARQAGREMARTLGFGTADQTRLATAISELTRNVIQYAGAGACVITDESSNDETRIRVVVEDSGPGIADVEKAMERGFSTGGGLGAGLPGAKRLVHDFRVDTAPGHTKITIVMVRKTL